MLLLLAIRNITARKSAERNLAAEAIRARGLVNQAPVALLIANKRNRIVAVNAAAQHLFGHDVDEVAGQPVTTILPEDLADKLLVSHDASADVVGEWQSYEGRRHDGMQIAFEAAISAVQDAAGRVAIVALRGLADVSAAKRDSLHRDVLRAAPDAIVVVDARGDIVLVNNEAERRFGYAESELIGRPATRILPEGFAERLKPDALRSTEAALAREIGTGIELVGQRRDNSRFPVELLLAPLETDHGAYWIATLRDLSVRRAAERHLVAAEEALASRVPMSSGKGAEGNREMQQFAYLVAHDLQEPLRMVASYTHLLAERYKGQLDADADDFIGYAVDGAKRMQVLIADMLNYCRVDTTGMRLEKLSSAELLDHALLNLKQAIGESGASVSSGELPEIFGDRTQIVQLFQNLVGNAIKYRGDALPAIEVSAARDGAGWAFAVSDNGIGIAPEQADKIFTMFHRLHRHDVIPGSGIGLAAARRIVERHGGRIWVTSTPGSGSTFHFTIPDQGDA